MPRRPAPGGRRTAGRRPGDGRPGGLLPALVGRPPVRRARGAAGRGRAGAVERHPDRCRARRPVDDADPALVITDPDRPVRPRRGSAGRARALSPGPAHALHLGHHRPVKGVWSGLWDDATAAARLRRRGRPVVVRPRRRPSGLLADVPLGLGPLRRGHPARGVDLVILGRFDAGTARRRPRRRGTGRCPPPPSWPRRPCSRLLALGAARGPVRFDRCACWSTPGRRARRRVKRAPSTGSAPVCSGSSTARPRASSPCAPPTDGWRSPGTVGRARPGRTLSVDDRTGPIWCRPPDFARFTYWGDEAKTGGVAGRLRSPWATSGAWTTRATSSSTADVTT